MDSRGERPPEREPLADLPRRENGTPSAIAARGPNLGGLALRFGLAVDRSERPAPPETPSAQRLSAVLALTLPRGPTVPNGARFHVEADLSNRVLRPRVGPTGVMDRAPPDDPLPSLKPPGQLAPGFVGPGPELDATGVLGLGKGLGNVLGKLLCEPEGVSGVNLPNVNDRPRALGRADPLIPQIRLARRDACAGRGPTTRGRVTGKFGIVRDEPTRDDQV